MFGLNEVEWNVVKKAAKGLNAAVEAMPKADRKNDKLMIEVITKHHKPIELLIDRYKFVWTAGYIAGRVGNRDADYE